MKKLIYVLEKLMKLCAAVLTMEVAAYLYSGIKYGFNHVAWPEWIDVAIGYPIILGSVWVVLHGGELLQKAVEFYQKKVRKPNLVVMKGGNIEGH